MLRHVFDRGAFTAFDVVEKKSKDEQHGKVGVYRDGRNPPDVPPNRLHPPQRPGVNGRSGRQKARTNTAPPAEQGRLTAPVLDVRPGCW